MSFAAPPEYEVVAFNSAKTSENKIHDDAVARQFGFAGGLVPGVDVYAYMCHAAVAHWGRAWLERGTMTARFVKPVYEGETVAVGAWAGAGAALEIDARSRGESCGLGAARLPERVPALPSEADFPRLALPALKPPATAAALPPGLLLGAYDCRQSREEAAKYLANVREALPLYAEAGLSHPGFLLRLANWALRANVQLGPWIHAASEVRNFAAVPVGTALSARARVLETYARKGHGFVALDVAVFMSSGAPALRVLHTAIYAPRRAAA